MNKNVLIVLGGAVLAAFLVAMLVQVTLGGKKEKASEGMEVLVAAKELRKGAELGKGDLTWKTLPEDALFKGAIIRKENKKADNVLKGRLERSFSEGEAVVRSAIISAKGNVLVARLDPGERAVSIKVNAAAMVAGFIAPGSYVDVILTYKVRMKVDEDGEDSKTLKEMVQQNVDKIASETILENVRVLAVDQKAERGDDKVKVGKTVTLAVAPIQAETLALAVEMGDITLSMRGVGDNAANPANPAATDVRLSTVDDEIRAEYESVKDHSDMNNSEVRIYNGASVQVSGAKGLNQASQVEEGGE